MPRSHRPPTSGYARIAQAEEDDSASDGDDDNTHPAALAGVQYAPLQPPRTPTMRMDGRSLPVSSGLRRQQQQQQPRQRANSGVDIKAINARFERWADEIAHKFKRQTQRETPADAQLEIHHSVFQAPDGVRPATAESLAADYEEEEDDDDYDNVDDNNNNTQNARSESKNKINNNRRMTKPQFDAVVESVRTAIELGVHPKLITQGSSGSYFARNTQGVVVGVFKPKDEEPYASRNPKWTKWIHRNLFPFFFGRACLIPNLSYVSEAAAYVLDAQLRTHLVPYTGIVALSSKSFHYDFWDRRAFYRRKKPFPDKPGSFQVFLKGFQDANIFLKAHPWPDQHSTGLRTARKKKRRWADDCRPNASPSDNDDDDDNDNDDDIENETHHENGAANAPGQRRPGRAFWTASLQQSFREQLEKLVILDYIMRNTDRGLDNWMIRIDHKTQEATIVAEPPTRNNDVDEGPESQPQPSDYTRKSMEEADPYGRREPMTTHSRSTTPMQPGPTPTVSIGAIDNSLSWPWKHPDAWRSYPFGWLFLPVSLIGQPFSETTRRHFLPLLTSSHWWSDTQRALRQCFSQDSDFKERMYAKQLAVMKGQAWNVVETLKTPDHGPLELTRRARVAVWDDVVEIPIAVPLRAPSAEMRRKQHSARHRRLDEEHEEMDITAISTPPQKPQPDLLMSSPPLDSAHENRFNLARDSSSLDVRRPEAGPVSPATVHGVHWESQTSKEPSDGRPPHHPRTSYDGPHRSLPENRRSQRRLSLSNRRDFNAHGSDDEGDLGYAANEDMEGNQKKVIVERLEMIKGKNPVFTWC